MPHFLSYSPQRLLDCSHLWIEREAPVIMTSSSRCPIDQCPSEILLEIFYKVANPFSRIREHTMEPEVRSLLAVSEVCKLWHSIVNGDDRLCALMVQPEAPRTILNRALSVSGTSPLFILSDISARRRDWARCSRRYAEVVGNYSRIFDHASRIQLFSVSLGPHPPWMDAELEQFLSNPTPLLISLTILKTSDRGPSDASDLSHHTRRNQALVRRLAGSVVAGARLRVLHLQGPSAMNPFLLSCQPSNLTQLILQGPPSDQRTQDFRFGPRGFHIQAIAHLLASMRVLEILVLDNVLQSVRPRPIGPFPLPTFEICDGRLPVIDLPLLIQLDLFDDLFGCARLLRAFSFRPGRIRNMRVHGAATCCDNFDENVFNNAIEIIMSPSMPSGTVVSLAIDSSLALRVEEDSIIKQDIKIDFGAYIGHRYCSQLFRCFARTVQAKFDGWKQQSQKVEVLRLMLDNQSEDLLDERNQFAANFLAGFHAVRELQLYGISYPAFAAVSGSAFTKAQDTAQYLLPQLARVVIPASSFFPYGVDAEDPSIYITERVPPALDFPHGIWSFLEMALRGRFSKDSGLM
ncbi:hypothetical protein BKA70DRAFT_1435363 [Coprinopsis sp. MPI-PUGE-AT-0042]|nr:hypothetical protein BKA70DRAFT_1435363 [Coprinopsis sp. MPI-PUGE-AT-0042]